MGAQQTKQTFLLNKENLALNDILLPLDILRQICAFLLVKEIFFVSLVSKSHYVQLYGSDDEFWEQMAQENYLVPSLFGEPEKQIKGAKLFLENRQLFANYIKRRAMYTWDPEKMYCKMSLSDMNRELHNGSENDLSIAIPSSGMMPSAIWKCILEIQIKFDTIGNSCWSGVGVCTATCLHCGSSDMFGSTSFKLDRYCGHYCSKSPDATHFNVAYFSNGYIGKNKISVTHNAPSFSGDTIGMRVEKNHDMGSVIVKFYKNGSQIYLVEHKYDSKTSLLFDDLVREQIDVLTM